MAGTESRWNATGASQDHVAWSVMAGCAEDLPFPRMWPKHYKDKPQIAQGVGARRQEHAGSLNSLPTEAISDCKGSIAGYMTFVIVQGLPATKEMVDGVKHYRATCHAPDCR